MFTYCTQVLHLSEHAAYNRIEAARAARRYPKILEGLAAGELTLTAVRLLAPSLTVENHEAVLQSARHKTRREVEHLVAAMRPQADVPATLRKLPCAPPRGSAAPATTSPGHTGCEGEAVMVQKERLAAEPPVASSAPNARAVLAPIAPERYKIQFTVPRETYDTLRRAQELLRHVVPSGDSAVIVGRALALLVADLEKRRGADVKQPRGAGTRPEPGASRRLAARETDGRTKLRRHIPAAVRRAVWARNEGRCAFVGTAGRCTERGLLEFHHVVPYADGGDATVGNLELRCRRHNRFEAERWFGEDRLPALVPETAPEWNEAEAGRPLVTETAGRSRCPSQG